MPMKQSVHYTYLIFLSLIAALGGFLFGYDTAVISGTISQVRELFELNAWQQGWYVGCALVGSIIGVLFAGVLSDHLGRKLTMLLSAIFFTVSAIGCALTGSFEMLVLYRIIGGVGIGIVSIVSPLYISEVAPGEYRGRLVSLYQLAVTIGFLGAYLVNFRLWSYAESSPAVSSSLYRLLFVEEVWRGMLGMEAIPAGIFLLAILLIAESPRWLIVRKRETEASHILHRIYDCPEEVTRHLEETKAILHTQPESDPDLFKHPGIRKALLIGVCIAILGQFMGVNAVLYYGPSIFEGAGFSGEDSLYYQVFIGLVNVLTTVIALLIIDKVGRKRLVYYGVSGMILCLLLIGSYFALGSRGVFSPVLLLVFFLGYVFCTAISISAVIFVFLSEMYPTRIRGLAMSIAGVSLWVGTFLVGQLTPRMLEVLRPAGTFFFFAAMCIPYLLIVWKEMPETAGKSLEEIERYWLEQKKHTSLSEKTQ